MINYFSGQERLETFTATGAPMRMGSFESLLVPDYQVLRNLVMAQKWEQSQHYLELYHAQNSGMIVFLFDWCLAMANLYAELTSKEQEAKLRPKAIEDYKYLVAKIKKEYSEKLDLDAIDEMVNFFNEENLFTQTSTLLQTRIEEAKSRLTKAFLQKDQTESPKQITSYHHQALIRHDSLITFTYSYPTSAMKESGEKIGLEIGNGSMLRNPTWNGLWELSKVLSPVDLAAFLAEHLRFHFSGLNREGQTQIIEDDKKVRLVFDPCGSGGALRRRLGDEIVNLKEKHQLGWNKCGEVNLYCSHCALNEKKSIDLFGYPKLVVEFSEDPKKPCGWTMYKNKEDIPTEVYERLGLKK